MEITAFGAAAARLVPIPLLSSRVSVGFPSPADDYVEAGLDLTELVVTHPATTYFVRVDGESMSGANIHTGDVLVVDRSLEPRAGSIVVAMVEGEATLKRYRTRAGLRRLALKAFGRLFICALHELSACNGRLTQARLCRSGRMREMKLPEAVILRCKRLFLRPL